LVSHEIKKPGISIRYSSFWDIMVRFEVRHKIRKFPAL